MLARYRTCWSKVGAEEARRSLWRRNCCNTKNISTEEGVVSDTNAFTAVVSAAGCALCAMEAEGGGIDYSAAAMLGATCLSGSSNTKAGKLGFPFLPFSEPTHLGSFACAVPMVPDGPVTSKVDGSRCS